MLSSNISDFIAAQKRRYNKCLDPELCCKNKAIKAHSIQNSNALELIEENNHVFELKMRIKDGKPTCSFELVGRRNASTFTGLCGEHDAEIFRPIDTKPLSIDDREQLFLIAYRSVTRELHATLEGAMRIQSAYEQLVAQGKAPKDKPSPAGIEAVQHMMKAHAAWNYRYKFFDVDLLNKRFENIQHSIFEIENERPILAASSFFSADLKPWGKPFAAVIVNVIPTGPSKTTVVFSYARKHSGKARRYIKPVMLAKDEMRKYELSYLLIDRAENFFISPHVVDGWPSEKRVQIEKSFFETVQSGKPKRLRHLMLFGEI